MRVKLSYTVDEDDVLTEAAKIVNLASDDMQQAISLFNEIQTVLRGENSDTDHVDVSLGLEMIDEYRKALFNIDTRLSEVVDIIESFEEYSREKKRAATRPPETTPTKAESK
tara:strand:- start:18 stop:353 length:336 start_codon:yes stop_codon:yes gene_type:complete